MRTPIRMRDVVARSKACLAPAVFNPLSARLAEEAGFEVLYLGGGLMGYVKTVLEANLSLTEMVQAGVEIRAVCDLPLILDEAGRVQVLEHTRIVEEPHVPELP